MVSSLRIAHMPLGGAGEGASLPACRTWRPCQGPGNRRPTDVLVVLSPYLVPVSVAVYGAYLTLLLRQHHGWACTLLGTCIYMAAAYACVYGSISLPADRRRMAPAYSPLTLLACTRWGMFVMTNVVAVNCVGYIVFLQHALQRGAPQQPARGALFQSALVECLLSTRWGWILLVNVGFGLLFSCFHVLRMHVFSGQLHAEELQRLSSRAGCYIAAKSVLLAVLDPQPLEVVMWLSWFSLIGFLRFVAWLVALRIDYLRLSQSMPRRARRLGALAHLLLGSSLWWAGVAALFSHTMGLDAQTFALLTTECILLSLDALFAVGKRSCLRIRRWERRRDLNCHLDMVYDVFCAVASVLQHVHTWTVNGLWGTLLDAFLLLNVYAEVAALAARLTEHSKFRERASALLRCREASDEDLQQFNDPCAVCLDSLSAVELDGWSLGTPRRLACGHIFHSACLSSWLEQHPTCPTCRRCTGTPPKAIAACSDDHHARQRHIQPDWRAPGDG